MLPRSLCRSVPRLASNHHHLVQKTIDFCTKSGADWVRARGAARIDRQSNSGPRRRSFDCLAGSPRTHSTPFFGADRADDFLKITPPASERGLWQVGRAVLTLSRHPLTVV